jgi:formylglycine-generating enzyme required for sulfatase activity
MEPAARRQDGRIQTIDLGDGVTMTLRLIPAGSFVMGNAAGHPDETPRLAVVDNPFWMGCFEVTNEQYHRFDPSHKSRFEHKGSWVFAEKHLGWPLDKPEQPVVRVSQREALAFCRWLSQKNGRSFTLPSEMQWEWACRAGSDMPFFYGGLNSDFYTYANMADAMIKKMAYDTDGRHTVDMVPRDERFDDGYLVTAPVGSYKPNAWGMCDMHGNVWEWTGSTYGTTSEYVARGGSWRDRPKRCTASFRIAYPDWQKVYNVGFRVVMEADREYQLARKQ